MLCRSTRGTSFLTKMAEGTPRISARIEHKKTVSRALCSAVMELTFESLEESATKAGLYVVQAWKAPRGEGFKAVAARFIVDGEDVLIVAFRGTRGKEEWLEYPTKWLTERFIAHPGFPEGSELQVFGVFSLALDEVRGCVLGGLAKLVFRGPRRMRFVCKPDLWVRRVFLLSISQRPWVAGTSTGTNSGS